VEMKIEGKSIHDQMKKYKQKKHRRKIRNAEFDKIRVRNRHYGKQGKND
jgi:hypothetical protein